MQHSHVTRDASPPVQLFAAEHTRLAELQAHYDGAKAAYEEAKARLEAVASALKAEMAASAPEGTTEILLTGSPAAPQLKLTWKRPYRFDVKRFRAEHPRMYVQYEVQSPGHWELREAK